MLSAGAISIFSYFQTARDRHLLLAAGILTIIIAVDDFFMLHEDIFPRKIGVPEIAIYAFYGIYVALVLKKFFNALVGKRHVGLYISVGLLFLSVAIDVAIDSLVTEDILKFMGVTLWSAYWINRAHLAGAVPTQQGRHGVQPETIPESLDHLSQKH